MAETKRDETFTCPQCDGNGHCPVCEYGDDLECPACEGTDACYRCEGTGRALPLIAIGELRRQLNLYDA